MRMDEPTRVVVLAALGVCSVAMFGCGAEGGTSPEPRAVPAPPAATGLKYASPETGVHLSARRLYPEGQSLGALRINLVQDLVLEGAELRLDIDETDPSQGLDNGSQAAVEEALSLVVGLVRHANGGVVLRDAKVVIHRDQTILHTLSAHEMRATGEGLALEGDVRVESRRGERLRAERVYWSTGSWELLVPGGFELSRATSVSSGQSARFRMFPDGTLRVPQATDAS